MRAFAAFMSALLLLAEVGLLGGCKKRVEPAAATAGTMTTTEEPPTGGTGNVPPTGGTGVGTGSAGTGVGTGGG